MASTRRIKVKGIRRTEIDTDLLGYVYFLQGKRLVQQRREQAAKHRRTKPAAAPERHKGTEPRS